MSENKIESRARPILVISAWALAMPLGAIVALYYGHGLIGAVLVWNAVALGWCDT